MCVWQRDLDDRLGAAKETHQCSINKAEEGDDEELAEDAHQQTVMYATIQDTAAQDTEKKIQQETAHQHFRRFLMD